MAQKASASRVAAYLGHHQYVTSTETFGNGQVKVWTDDNGGLLNGDVFRELREKFGFNVQAVSAAKGTVYVQ